MVVKFVAYIDESGDTGLEDVKKPDQPKGASEWLVLSCFLVRETDDHKCVGWVKEILAQFKTNKQHLHFSDLWDWKKVIACNAIAKKPCRYFIVASNKRNIEDYQNPAAARASGQTGTAWLYWFLSRLLLERVTDYCEELTPPEQRDKWKLRIIFSRRGGLMYKDFDRYLWKLKWDSVLGTLALSLGDLAWSVIDFDEVRVLDHKERAGLQLADIGAGAFYNALEQNRPANCDPQYAKLLASRVAKDKAGRVLGYGLKTMPQLYKMGLTLEQREIFEFFGYSKEGW